MSNLTIHVSNLGDPLSNLTIHVSNLGRSAVQFDDPSVKFERSYVEHWGLARVTAHGPALERSTSTWNTQTAAAQTIHLRRLISCHLDIALAQHQRILRERMATRQSYPDQVDRRSGEGRVRGIGGFGRAGGLLTMAIVERTAVGIWQSG
jgi:hypothetical protein